VKRKVNRRGQSKGEKNAAMVCRGYNCTVSIVKRGVSNGGGGRFFGVAKIRSDRIPKTVSMREKIQKGLLS